MTIGVVLFDFLVVRPEDRVIRAWSVIAQSNIGQGNIGQIAALKTLKKKGEDIRGINLNTAWLIKADLSDLDLSRVDFTTANLSSADLRGTNLTEAVFKGANVTGANFGGANLSGAVFLEFPTGKTNVTGANFLNSVNIPDLSEACANPNNPPRNLPIEVKRPDLWVACPD